MPDWKALLAGELHPQGGRLTLETADAMYEAEFGWVKHPRPGIEEPWTDRIADMPTNFQPFHPDFVRNFPGATTWPLRRSLADIRGLTIHHTLSHSPEATARHIVNGKGYPTSQYHFWVSAADGAPTWLLVDPLLKVWHDHTGAYPKTVSIGMAGRLHEAKPPQEQMDSLLRLVYYLMGQWHLRVSQVEGHLERAAAGGIGTLCPGWVAADWRGDFYNQLEAMG